MSRNGLYFLILCLSLAGYLWILINYNSTVQQYFSETSICIFRNITGVPCPSCGTTRSVLAILDGDLMNSIDHNPFGLVVVILLTVLPFWVVIDLMQGKRSFLRFYKYAERSLKRKYIAIPSISIVVVVWLKTIYEHL